MDGDTAEKLRNRAEFIVDSGVDVMQLTTMTPLPGTQLCQNLEQEGRLLYAQVPQDWNHYDLFELVHQPKARERDEFRSVIQECISQGRPDRGRKPMP